MEKVINAGYDGIRFAKEARQIVENSTAVTSSHLLVKYISVLNGRLSSAITAEQSLHEQIDLLKELNATLIGLLSTSKLQELK